MKTGYPLELLRVSQGLDLKHYVNWGIKTKSDVIKHLPDKENFINKIWKQCVVLLCLTKFQKQTIKKTLSTLVCRQRNKWTILLDKFATWNPISSQEIELVIYWFQILVQELTSKEKDLRPFWTPVYKELSDKLWLPIKIDYVDSDTNLLKDSYIKQEDLSQYWTKINISLQNKNLQKTCYPLLPSTLVNKWEEENISQSIIKIKKIKLKPSKQQRKCIDEWIDTSRYVYNKVLQDIKQGEMINFFNLRNKHVTKERNKIRNQYVLDWELQTPKDIRAGAVNDVCKAYKTGFSQLKTGHIRYFDPKPRTKKYSSQCIVIQSNAIKIKNGQVSMYSRYLSKLNMGKRTRKKYNDFRINSDCRLVKKNEEYWLYIPDKQVSKVNTDGYKRIIGLDPGVRKMMTGFGDTMVYYNQRQDLIKRLNKKIDLLKSFRMRPRCEKERNKYRRRKIRKHEWRKECLVETIHCEIVNDLIKNQDVIFLGDIESQGIAKKGRNRTLNRDILDLKLYKFKMRLEHKAKEYNKRLMMVNESYTSKTCTNCGILNTDLKSSERFICKHCDLKMDRDMNGARNILLKGLISVRVRCG